MTAKLTVTTQHLSTAQSSERRGATRSITRPEERRRKVELIGGSSAHPMRREIIFVSLIGVGIACCLPLFGGELKALRWSLLGQTDLGEEKHLDKFSTTLPVVPVERPVNKSEYRFWKTSFQPSNQTKHLLRLEEQSGKRVENHFIGRVQGKSKEWDSNTVVVPMDAFLWARKVARSAKVSLRDSLVIVGSLWDGFLDYAKEVRELRQTEEEAGTVFIVWHSHPASKGQCNHSFRKIALPALGVYLLDSNCFPPVQLLALIEIADTYIAVEGEGARSSAGVETATLVLLPREVSSSSTHTNAATSELLVDDEEDDGEGSQSRRKENSEIREAESERKSNEEEAKKRRNKAGLWIQWMERYATTALARITLEVMKEERVDLIFESYLNPLMGYGSSAEDMALSLAQAGLTVRYAELDLHKLYQWEKVIKPETKELLARTGLSDCYLGYFVPHDWPGNVVPRLARKAKYSIIYTTFETTKVPSDWVEIINRYDELVVSCETIRKAFVETGVTIPTSVVPLGVNTEDWPALTRTEFFPFRFLLFADGAWNNHRKNYQLVYDAFLQEYTNDSSVELHLKLTTKTSELEAIQRTAPSNVYFYEERLAQRKLLTLMKKTHCLVFPSRGEGFGLPPREAMATGMPVILAGFAGLESIAQEEFAFPLEWEWTRAVGYDGWRVFNKESDDFGWWAEIDMTSLRQRMRQASSNPRATLRKGRAAAKYIREHEVYEHTARLLIQLYHGWLPSP